MIGKNELKYYSSLLQKKYRKSEEKFLAEGKKNVLEGINSNYSAEAIFVTEKFIEKEKMIFSSISSRRIRTEKIKSSEFRRISDTKSPEGIAAVFSSNLPLNSVSRINDELIVFLENISDPGNLGTIIRNCDWFGTKNVLLSKQSAEVYNPKVIRASMGSIFHINTYENMTLKKISEFRKKGYEYLCADTSGENIYNYKRKNKIILFLSNESAGPSGELKAAADKSITIPGKGKAESLNVASSSAILLAELTR